MSADLVERVSGFSGLRVVVLGEAMLDCYLYGRADRLSSEAPVPIVALSDRVDSPGGAANTAVNVASLGAHVTLLSAIGDDGEGDRLRAALAARGVDTDGLEVVPGRETLTKERVLAGDQMLLRVDSGTTTDVDTRTESRLIDQLTSAYRDADAVIVSDYDYGILTSGVVAALADLERDEPRTLVVDARDLGRYRDLPVSAVKPNYGEAVRLLGEAERRGSRQRALQVARAGDRLLDLTGARIVAVTMDADGVFVFERGAPPHRAYCRRHADVRATGGGDTFVATLALALAGDANAREAAELASAAASIVVAQPGTATCMARDLIGLLSASTKRIDALDELRRRADLYRSLGQRIVFTNGCFDILHPGHTSYLDRAKTLGDVLFVGVNSDDSVRRLKGPDRPINTLQDRLQVLEALASVDHVVPFSDDSPEALLEAVRPDIFTKGGDYTRASLPEASLVERLGGTVEILPLVEDRSTTTILARARERGGSRGRRDPADGALAAEARSS